MAAPTTIEMAGSAATEATVATSSEAGVIICRATVDAGAATATRSRTLPTKKRSNHEAVTGPSSRKPASPSSTTTTPSLRLTSSERLARLRDTKDTDLIEVLITDTYTNYVDI